jgi:hypothetical protein
MPADDQRLTQIEIIPIRDYVDVRFKDIDAMLKVRDYIDHRIEHVTTQIVQSKEAKSELFLAEVRRIDARLDGLLSLMSSNFSAVEKATVILTSKTEAQFLAVAGTQLLAKDALQQQFQAIKDATSTATDALDKRLESMNEFRAQMNDWAGKFITRPDVESANKYLGDRVASCENSIGMCITRTEMQTQQSSMSERVSSLEKFSNNMQGRMWVIAAVVVIMEVAMRFIGAK